jgi:hypothetical protein
MSRLRHLTIRIAPRRSESTRFVPTNAIFRIPKELTRSAFGLLGCRWWKVIPMLKPKTHFEQVPLTMVRQIVVGQVRREIRAKEDQLRRKKKLEKEDLAAPEQSIERF